MSIQKHMELPVIQAQEIMEIRLPEEISKSIKEYIDQELQNHNPYTCDEMLMVPFVRKVVADLVDYGQRQQDTEVDKLLYVIKQAHCNGNIPPLFIRNTPSDSVDTLLPAENRKGYDYGSNMHDRMKLYFYSEWVTWLFASLMNHDAVIHPSEHGGKNRFHFITPVSFEDGKLRNTGASTGGGNFYQHSDATVYTDLKDRSDIESRFREFNTSLETVAERLNKPVEAVVAEMTSGKFTRVDALLLKGILNKNTRTHLGTPKLLQQHLEDNDFTKEEILTLSKMPIAHIAGPADGEISGYVGEINSIVGLDENGNIISTCLNGAENRLIYVGQDESESVLFDQFLSLLRTMPTQKVLLTSTDLLFIPNTSYGNQTNVTHGRERLNDDEYRIPIGDNKFGRRMHCRQYVSSRARDNKPSHLGDLLDAF